MASLMDYLRRLIGGSTITTTTSVTTTTVERDRVHRRLTLQEARLKRLRTIDAQVDAARASAKGNE